MYTFQYLDHLPAIPQHLVPRPDRIDTSLDSTAHQRTLIRDGQKSMAGINRRHALEADLQSWIKNHIVPEWQNAGISITTAPCHGPHIDRSRFFTLQYLLDPGGPAVQTVFYQPKFLSLDMEPGYFFFNNYDQLLVTQSHVFQLGRWLIIDGRNNIHSVENIQDRRISVQIGLMKDPFLIKQE